MPTSTPNFSFNKPLVSDPVDEDLWGGLLNDNWDSIDTILDELVPIGFRAGYVGTAAPNSRWLLCDDSAVSRTTYAALFALISTSYGIGDGSTTFNLPDYRGRTAVGLDNLGGSSANRITDTNADSLNNTGGGDEDISLTGPTDGHALTSGENGPHTHPITEQMYAEGGTVNDHIADGGSAPGATLSITTDSSGSGTEHDHDLTGVGGDNTQPWIAEGVIIRAL